MPSLLPTDHTGHYYLSVNKHLQLWNDFCKYHAVLNGMRPLLTTETGLMVKTRQMGKSRPRTILCRSAEMEALIKEEGAKLIDDWQQKTFQYDGLIYMMLAEGEKGPVPLYIGKTETLVKGNGNLSENIKDLAKNTANFARWGDNYAYHIGDLAAVARPGHDPKKS